VFFRIVATTQATNNFVLGIREMQDNTPGRESVFVGHAPLPLAAMPARASSVFKSGCGIDIMSFASKFTWG
jgi:hypothetical protein